MLRLRCMLELMVARLCHFIRRYICALLLVLSLLPRRSVPLLSIMVTRPLFSFVYFIGLPVRARSSNWSESNERHSFPVSIVSSPTTRPHFWQMTSPVSMSLTILLLLHSGHFSVMIAPAKIVFIYKNSVISQISQQENLLLRGLRNS